MKYTPKIEKEIKKLNHMYDLRDAGKLRQRAIIRQDQLVKYLIASMIEDEEKKS